MSTNVVKRFMQQAGRDPSIRVRLAGIPLRGGRQSVNEIVQIAGDAGFEFNSEEYEAAVNEMLEEKHAAGVLNDEELAIVSGGRMCVSSDGSKKCLCCNL